MSTYRVLVNGRVFASCDDKGRAVRLASVLGGTVETWVFGSWVANNTPEHFAPGPLVFDYGEDLW